MSQDRDPDVIRVKAAGKSVQRTHEAAQAIKLMNENDIVRPKQLSHASRQEITACRVALKLTQIQLNQNCGFPAGTINKIENGQLIPTPSQLGRINRALNTSVKLEV